MASLLSHIRIVNRLGMHSALRKGEGKTVGGDGDNAAGRRGADITAGGGPDYQAALVVDSECCSRCINKN